jgi:predicted RecB family nuclease
MDVFLEKYFIDLRRFAEKVIFPPKKSPVCNYSIKTLAPFANFKWRMDDAGGAMSTFKYEEAIGLDQVRVTAAQKWLLEYNEDDVKATMAFRHWLSEFFKN